MTMLVAMQPTYLPWTGYFDLMELADIFVFLDSVQFERRSWQQRNRIKGPDGELFLTVPVKKKGRRSQRIDEVEIADPSFRTAHLETLRHCYAHAPYFSEHVEVLTAAYGSEQRLLVDLDLSLIFRLRETLGISTEVLRSSELEVEGAKSELLVAICRKLGADSYLTPARSGGYIGQGAEFRAAGIDVFFHRYNHPEYRQLFGPFLPFLSVLDLILNEGPRSRDVLRSGRLDPQPLHGEGS